MNVLYLTEEPITFSGTMVRGGQIHVRNVVNGLRERGHDVHLVDWNDTPERPYQHSVSPRIRYGLDPLRAAARSVAVGREVGTDVVISKTRKTYVPGLAAAQALGLPHVVHVGSSPGSTDDGLGATVDRLSVRSRLRAPHDGYFVVCDALRKELAGIGIDDDGIHGVKNAVDTGRFHPERVPTPLNSEHGDRIDAFDDGRFLLGFVGGIHSYKGLDDLTVAMDRVNGDSGVVIAGDGPDRERLERRFGNDGLFLGAVPYEQVPALYHRFDAFVLPSHTEGLPRVVLEAQATGTPVIATRVGGVPEIIDDGKTGLLVDSKSQNQLATAVETVAGDRELRSRLKQNGRDAVVNAYSWKSMYDRYERYLTEVVNRFNRNE